MLAHDEVVEVYTVGHSNRSLDDFLKLLEKYKIDVIVDVRRFPSSKKYPHFKKEELKKTLEEHGFSYSWLGDKLGGFRPGGYEAYMETEDFKKGFQELLKIIREESARGKRVAIMCRERLWFKCHRRFISDVLVWLGYRVIHVIDEEKTYVHKKSRKIEFYLKMEK